MTASPADRGFYLPAEWAPHRATWLSWPHNRETWPDLPRIEAVFAEMARLLSQTEHVCINVQDTAMARRVQDLLDGHGCDLNQLAVYEHPTNDSWIRDHGPMILAHRTRPERLALDWMFNAWGGKYPPFDDDDAVPSRIATRLGLRLERPGLVLEGGSVDVNGRGTLLTTTSCLLHPNRNPTLDQAAIERALVEAFGVSNVLWLGDGIVGDDTDGHVDDLTRFVDERTVVTAVEPLATDANHHALADNLARLQGMTLEDGRPLKIQELPMPDPVYQDGVRLPASYANFYIANGLVLVPVFQAPQDDAALRVLESVFRARTVHPIPARDLVWGLGAIHCLTQQEPAPGPSPA